MRELTILFGSTRNANALKSHKSPIAGTQRGCQQDSAWCGANKLTICYVDRLDLVSTANNNN